MLIFCLICSCAVLLQCFLLDRRLTECKHKLEESVQLILLIEQDARELKQYIDSVKEVS